MDPRKISELLRATIDPNQRASAEQQLKEIEKIIGLAPALLQIVMSNELEMPVRQAGVIYLKNYLYQSWAEDEDDSTRFHIHEQDRAMVRDALVDAAVHAPTIIRSQLGECIGYVCKQDWPSRWSSLVDKLVVYLQSPEPQGWPGSLTALRAVVKVYEYRKGAERNNLDEAMALLLPLVQRIMVGLLPDGSVASLMMQRLVLKTFHALTQHQLPLSLFGEKGSWQGFIQWMEVIRQVLDRSNPEYEKRPEDDDDREELEGQEWWKTKKWAMRILYRMFERYGSPGGVTKEYKEFALFYLNNFSEGALRVVFKTMECYRTGSFVSEPVLRDSILYLKNGVSHAHSWKFMKDHAAIMLSDVIFPLLCHSETDDKLWKDDPIEYIRSRYGEALDEDSSIVCGEQLLNSMCKKRKGVLATCVQLVNKILNDPNSTPQHKDGALHMVGSVADILLKKEEYKESFDDVIVRFVFPSMSAPYPFIRARAAWLMQRLSTLRFAREEVLSECLNILLRALLSKEEELPVKVEAAFALEAFIQDQHRSHPFLQPQIKTMTLELLSIVRSTEIDDITNVLQKIVCSFVEDVAPIALEICTHLALTFEQIMDSTASADDSEKTIVAMGLLNTMETVLVVMEEQPEICKHLEPVLLQVVMMILEKSIMEFYEEAFSLIASLTDKQISPQMWQVFEGLYRVVERDGTDYFVEMTPCLHNYITVDTDAFLQDPNRLIALCTVIKKVLLDDNGEAGEDAECHAAKLMEVLILQCRVKIQNVIPDLLQLVLERLNRPIKTTELRTMCLQVVVASLYHDFNLTQSVVSGMDAFVKQWIADTDCFLGLHDRKICVLGLCALLQSPNKPMALQECSKEVLPSLILLFDGLKRAYAAKALENADSDSEEEEEDEECEVEEALSTDEDDIDEESAEYLESLQKKLNRSAANASFPMTTDVKNDDDDDDDDDDYSEGEETALECYHTPLDDEESPIDEYVVFKEVLLGLQQREPDWYVMLTTGLNEGQLKSLEEIFKLADQRKEAAKSKAIQKKGGFEFRPQDVPATFNFGNGSISEFGRQ